jgi:hypothetical protein
MVTPRVPRPGGIRLKSEIFQNLALEQRIAKMAKLVFSGRKEVTYVNRSKRCKLSIDEISQRDNWYRRAART